MGGMYIYIYGHFDVSLMNIDVSYMNIYIYTSFWCIINKMGLYTIYHQLFGYVDVSCLPLTVDTSTYPMILYR